MNCHVPKGTHDRSKRIVHVANTEQRIAFKEVTLIPKAPNEQEISKGKDLEETPKETNLNIDRIIGLSAPASRAPRKKKATSSTSATKSKAKGKGKEKAGPSKPSNAKGKEKEVIEDVPMDEDVSETNIDDIYMDE
jgi:general transcription factor 3C polypeptide 6